MLQSSVTSVSRGENHYSKWHTGLRLFLRFLGIFFFTFFETSFGRLGFFQNSWTLLLFYFRRKMYGLFFGLFFPRIWQPQILHTFQIRIKFIRIVEVQIPKNQKIPKNHAENRFSLSQTNNSFRNSRFPKMITHVIKFFIQ